MVLVAEPVVLVVSLAQAVVQLAQAMVQSPQQWLPVAASGRPVVQLHCPPAPDRLHRLTAEPWLGPGCAASRLVQLSYVTRLQWVLDGQCDAVEVQFGSTLFVRESDLASAHCARRENVVLVEA